VPQVFPNPRAQISVERGIPSAVRKLDAHATLRLWHLASLDAPTVAVVWSLAFAWVTRIHLPVWIPVLLALAAWAVYICDRLLDARAAFRIANLDSLRERHLFQHRHRRLLLPVALAAASTALWIVFTQLPSIARERNSALAVAALAYFTGVHFPRKIPRLSLSPLLKKEPLVGLLFTAACALPALTRATASTRGPLAVAALFFALLAWLNCYAIDRWEASHRLNCAQIITPACCLAVAALTLVALLDSTRPRFAALLLAGAISALLLALLDRSRARLTPIALRAAADLALLTPLALLLK